MKRIFADTQEAYEDIISTLLRNGILNKEMSILVVCGNKTDKDLLSRFDFKKVVISNLDNRIENDDYLPYTWSFQNAEGLSFEDEKFDFCIVHAGLHHCYSPHRGLLEMYRVSKKGILVVEPNDSLLTTLGVKLNFGQDYEQSAVFHNNCKFGGVKNSSIPNYVYRWAEQEFIKTINSFAPHAKHGYKFFYIMSFPWNQLKGRKNKIVYFSALVFIPLLKMLTFLFPRQCNIIAAVISKPSIPADLHPWLTFENDKVGLNLKWFGRHFRKE